MLPAGPSPVSDDVVVLLATDHREVGWVDLEFVLVALATMLSPLTLIWSVLALVLSNRPLYTGVWFYLGALFATLAIGIGAAFVLGDGAASRHSSTPKTPVAIFDLIGGILLLLLALRMIRRPPNPKKQEAMVDRMRSVTTSPAIAIVGAGALLANPGVFVPFAIKSISETGPSTAGFILEWTVYALVGLLPLTVAIVMLLVARDRTEQALGIARDWLVLHSDTIAGGIVFLLSLSLLRGGIAGLTS
jgi:Sap, sulfolipid-1-addressing protein